MVVLNKDLESGEVIDYLTDQEKRRELIQILLRGGLSGEEVEKFLTILTREKFALCKKVNSFL